MTSNLSQFHFLASTVPNKFDFEEESFDVSQIYQFYALKVSTRHHHTRYASILTKLIVYLI